MKTTFCKSSGCCLIVSVSLVENTGELRDYLSRGYIGTVKSYEILGNLIQKERKMQYFKDDESASTIRIIYLRTEIDK